MLINTHAYTLASTCTLKLYLLKTNSFTNLRFCSNPCKLKNAAMMSNHWISV